MTTLQATQESVASLGNFFIQVVVALKQQVRKISLLAIASKKAFQCHVKNPRSMQNVDCSVINSLKVTH
jgi:hypothetical protein